MINMPVLIGGGGAYKKRKRDMVFRQLIPVRCGPPVTTVDALRTRTQTA